MTRPFLMALFACILAAAIPLGALGLSHLAYAEGQADAPALFDAGPTAPPPTAFAPSGVADDAEDAVPTAPPAFTLDPAGDPLGTGSLVWRLWRGGALIPALLVGIFGLLVLASRYVAWLSEGRRAVYTAAAIAGLGMLAEPATRGTTPNMGMVIAAIGAMTALLFPPTKPKGAG